MISPAVFIDTLEKHQKIYALDISILESVCKKYNEIVSKGIIPLPFSVNLSRLDFVHADLFDRITSILERYNVPASAVHIEITESVLLDNTYLFKKIFDRFKNAGSEMWLDDFGSGYTSLNVLKEYDFDVIKLDMRFFSSMTARSKKIISAVVSMAKSLGCHTLAEGVECVEHLAFLKEIGCEMLQGYYFAKPMDRIMLREYLQNGKVHIESAEKRNYVNTVGLINLLSSDPLNDHDPEAEASCIYPLALLEYENEVFRFIYANKPYKDQLYTLGFSGLMDAEKQINDRSNRFYSGTVSLMSGCTETGKTLTRNYVIGDKYYSLSMKYLAKSENKTMLALSLHVFLENGIEDRYNEINKYSKALFCNFELVNIIDPDSDSSNQIYSNLDFDHSYGRSPLRLGIKAFAENVIFDDDKERYLSFMDMDTLKERIESSGCSLIQSPFRIKTSLTEKKYHWHLIKIVAVPLPLSEVSYMFSMQHIPDSDAAIVDKFFC